MAKVASLVVAATVLAASAGGDAFAQSRLSRDPAYALGQTIASTATTAERAAPDAASVQASVRMAVERAIIAAGAEPQVVLAALDTALAACRPVGGRSTPEWTCPASPPAYLALNSLRLIVVAELEQTDPAALKTPGSSALGSLMTTAPSANYIHF
jgi:hypothetical protein